ncbi:probable protein phosphatase 2C 27 [Olea europaea var. sylvestris]|uniref:probable protein phosphatase 2C 27 n=1 Tax=Olea europaea var. sylvestris TaxID=158386 RepID=UPI000C1D2848|nr:probable protein phosphatase 2C 27 [Olea europaea var. sylvestris]
MAAGTDFSPLFTTVEGGYNSDDNVAAAEKDGIDDLRKSSNGKPPRNLSVARHSMNTTTLVSPSNLDYDLGVIEIKSPSDVNSSFIPVFRSGSCAEKGPKPYMEDDHICIDNLPQHLGEIAGFPSLGAFYGVFDGHGGTDAASFVRNNILKLIVEDSCFPACIEKAIKNAFLKADYAFADDSSLDISSGTTALTAIISGR